MEAEKLPGVSAEENAENNAAHGQAERSRQQAESSWHKLHPNEIGESDDSASEKQAAAGIMIILLCRKPVSYPCCLL